MPLFIVTTLIILVTKVRKSFISLTPLILILCRCATILYLFNQIVESDPKNRVDDKKNYVDEILYMILASYTFFSIKPRIDLMVTIPLSFLANGITIFTLLADEDGNMDGYLNPGLYR